jgi:hypothetical protein
VNAQRTTKKNVWNGNHKKLSGLAGLYQVRAGFYFKLKITGANCSIGNDFIGFIKAFLHIIMIISKIKINSYLAILQSSGKKTR